MTKTIAVTGAAGHLGNTVCRALIAKGYQVHAFYHSDKKALNGLPLKLFRGSVLNYNNVFAVLKDCDAVIHCAGIISINGDPTGIVHRTNTEGPLHVINACMALGIKKLIHVSSVHAVAEHPLDAVFDETRGYKQSGSYAYDFSKATGEQLVLKAFEDKKVEGCVVRPSLIIGPYDFKPSEIGKALMDLYKGKIPALPRGGYNFVDVRDVADAIVEALDQGRNGAVYHLTGTYHSMQELSAIIGEVTGKHMPSLIIPFWLMQFSLPFIRAYSRVTGAAPVFTKEAIAALKYGHTNMSNAKAAQELHLQARPLKESVQDFYSWQQEQQQIILSV